MLSSLRIRLIVICVLIVALCMIVLSVANIVTVRSDIRQTLNTQMELLTESHADSIGEWVRNKRTTTASMKSAAMQNDVMSVIKAAKLAGPFYHAYIGYADKRMATETNLPADYDPTKRPWYMKAVEVGGPILTAPYLDVSSGKLVVTFADPVIENGKATAVVGTDVELDNVVKHLGAIKPTPDSSAFLVDNKGLIVTHPNRDFALKPITALDPALSAGALNDMGKQNAGAPASFNGVDQLLYVRKIEGTDWSLVLALNYDEAVAPVRALRRLSIIATLVAIVVAALALTVSITGLLARLGLVRDALQNIVSGEGDLTRRLGASGRDELAHISGAFNQFANKMAATLIEIRHASTSVKSSASEIASGNFDLSGRTEQQAGSLEETASAMEQLTTTVKQNADNAQQANQLAVSASDVAIQGGKIVGQVVETMGSINTSARKIVDIISVIDGIAFQTNILALNAAVEAARAGEQGRGFAVVASEVRGLAQRSAVAAKEIKNLIDDSVQKVDAGSQLVEQAGNTMSELVTSVRRVTDIVGEISIASREQSARIAEVGSAISQMDEATQQNAALVEQAAAAAQSLQDQATHLDAIVGAFKLEEGGGKPAAVAAVVTAPPPKKTVAPKPTAKPAIKPAAKPAAAKPVRTVALAGPGQDARPGDNGSWEEF